MQDVVWCPYGVKKEQGSGKSHRTGQERKNLESLVVLFPREVFERRSIARHKIFCYCGTSPISQKQPARDDSTDYKNRHFFLPPTLFSRLDQSYYFCTILSSMLRFLRAIL